MSASRAPRDAPAPPGTDVAVSTPEEHLRLHAARALEALEATTERPGDLPVELVHDARTSLRRLRAAVRTVSALVADPAEVEDSLREVALALGAVRDIDVLAELLLPAADALAPAATAGRSRALLEQELAVRRETALAALPRAAESLGWQEAVALLREWSRTPPPLPPLEVAQVLARAESVVRRRLREAGTDRAALHSARKAAKRWRYGAELFAADPGAAPHRQRAEAVQDELGLIQDLEIGLALLDELTADETRHTAGSAGHGTSSGAHDVTGLEQLRSTLAERQRELVTAVVARTAEPRPQAAGGPAATRDSAAPPGLDGCPAPGR